MNDISETKETIFTAITNQYGLPGNVLVLYHKLETESQYESNHIRISTSWRLGFENNCLCSLYGRQFRASLYTDSAHSNSVTDRSTAEFVFNITEQ